MRVFLSSLTLAIAVASSACGPRRVEVTTGPEPAADVALRLTNNLSQAVNVYVTTGGSDVFLKQVSANSVEVIPIRGIASGTSVTLKARTVDGARTYTRDNVVLVSPYEWRVP
jgi:hypothetical protein